MPALRFTFQDMARELDSLGKCLECSELLNADLWAMTSGNSISVMTRQDL